MATYRITCIEKNNVGSISFVGNPAERWRFSEAEVIRAIDAGNIFYVIDPRTGKRAQVGVVRGHYQTPYLRTYADGYWNDNLLSLDQCSF